MCPKDPSDGEFWATELIGFRIDAASESGLVDTSLGTRDSTNIYCLPHLNTAWVPSEHWVNCDIPTHLAR
ncbi:hypothetical protein LBMAG03_14230 [Actinomycetes bacterium]|nr:hypothetical protein LBMAG03_14230 [Actinomycetes bacterium]